MDYTPKNDNSKEGGWGDNYFRKEKMAYSKVSFPQYPFQRCND